MCSNWASDDFISQPPAEMATAGGFNPLPPPYPKLIDPYHMWVVDMQYFQPSTEIQSNGTDGIFPKEISLLKFSAIDGSVVCFTCKSDFAIMNTKEYETVQWQKRQHRIDVHEGDVMDWMLEVKRHIPANDVIFIKGHAKMEFLKRKFHEYYTVYDIDKIKSKSGETVCPKLADLFKDTRLSYGLNLHKCLMHFQKKSYMCTMPNVILLRRYVISAYKNG